MTNHPDNQPATPVDAPTQAASESITDQACEILRATHDGDHLDSQHLKLVEAMINGWCTEAGEVAFAELLANVRQPGGYVKPWYHDFEHLTRDHEGYVYWRNVQVEHYSFRDYDAAHVAATKLVEACLTIEARGETVNGANVLQELSTKPGTPADHPVVYRADSIADLRAALRGDV